MVIFSSTVHFACSFSVKRSKSLGTPRRFIKMFFISIDSSGKEKNSGFGAVLNCQ
jgi:hypothetical protein